MKMLIIYLYSLVVLCCFQWNIDASSPPDMSGNLTKLESLLGHHRSHLHAVLHTLRGHLDQHLVERFPQLNSSISQLHGNIDYCYKQTVGGNETINIFKEKLHSVAVKFFKVHGKILQNLSFAQVKKRVQYLIGNLGTFAQLLVECVEAKERGQETMTFALNHFAVYSEEEFQNQGGKERSKRVQNLGGGAPKLGSSKRPDECSKERLHGEAEEIPESFSWRDKGYVSEVYTQGHCGSCYVFASVSALESQYMISRRAANQPTKLSMQETLNCQAGGCNGGYIEDMMEYFVKEGAPKDRYGPYTGQVATCKKHSHLIRADGSCTEHDLSEKQIQRLVMRNGPAVVMVPSHSQDIKYLKDSVFRGTCAGKLSHFVVLVGWKVKDGLSVWELKNSWGTHWGLEGYLYLPMGEKTKQCQMAKRLIFPLIKRKHHSHHHKHHHKHEHHHSHDIDQDKHHHKHHHHHKHGPKA